eukprot:6896380-Pyramimonas_sp.AAC.1
MLLRLRLQPWAQRSPDRCGLRRRAHLGGKGHSPQWRRRRASERREVEKALQKEPGARGPEKTGQRVSLVGHLLL